MVTGRCVCVFFEAIWVSWATIDCRHELCVNPMGSNERVPPSAYATVTGQWPQKSKEYLNPRQCLIQSLFDVLPTLFSCRIPCFGLSTLCVFRPPAPSVHSAYRFKSSRLRYFPLVCMPRHLHPRLCCESGLAQYLPVLAMCCLQATRGMGVALLLVTAHRII
jgi:hypothetical protein